MNGRRGPQVFLHIGPMKTGTTYLQQVLIHNREALAEGGYLFPGADWGDQVRAARDAVGVPRRHGIPARPVGLWNAAVQEMLDHPGKAALFSVEFLSFAGRRRARKIIRDLAPAELHVVVTARDARQVLPSLWQTHCANGGTASWTGYLRSARLGARVPRSPALVAGQGARLFRNALDVPGILERWALVPPERLHVVTVPPRGSPRGLLWERFATALGLDPTLAATDVSGPVNPSLGYASADLMRRVNAALGRLQTPRYDATLKRPLALGYLVQRAGDEQSVPLDATSAGFAAAWNARTRSAIERNGCDLVGDLEDLPVTTSHLDLSPIRPPDLTDSLAAAADACARMERVVHRRADRLRAGGDQAPVAEVDRAAQERARASWQGSDDPLAEAVRDLAAVCRIAVGCQDRLDVIDRRRRGYSRAEHYSSAE